MEALKILDQEPSLTWYFDDEADVLYISIGEPKPSVGTDIGDGTIVRYDENNNEVTGITIVDFRDRIMKNLPNK